MAESGEEFTWLKLELFEHAFGLCSGQDREQALQIFDQFAFLRAALHGCGLEILEIGWK